MNCKREVVVPVSIINKKEYNICVLKTSFYNGIYYGTVLLLFIITLLVYYKLKKKPFLYYSFVLFFKSLVLFFHDNLFHVFFIKNSSNFAYEIIVHFLLVYFEFWFVYYYLNFKKHLPWTKKMIYIVFTIIILLFITYFITGNYYFIFAGDILIASVITLNIFLSFTLIKKENYAIYYFLANILLFFFSFLYYVNPMMGFSQFGISIAHLKFASLLELFILSYAFIHKMSLVNKVNKKMISELYNYTKEINLLKEELENKNSSNIDILNSANLNEREKEILLLISEGKKNKEIAESLYISVNTVKYHIKKLYDKLNVKSREEARFKAKQLDL